MGTEGSSDTDDDADGESENADMDDDEQSLLQDEVRYSSPSLEICKLTIL